MNSHTLAIALPWLITSAAAYAQPPGLPLMTGEKFQFEFSTLAYEKDLPGASDLSQVAVTLDPRDLLSVGESLTVRMYPNSALDQPFWEVSVSGESPPNPANDVGFFSVGPVGRQWADLQGAVEVEMTSGSCRLDSLTFSVDRDGKRFSAVYAIPESSPAALWVLGCGCLVIARKVGEPRPPA